MLQIKSLNESRAPLHTHIFSGRLTPLSHVQVLDTVPDLSPRAYEDNPNSPFYQAPAEKASAATAAADMPDTPSQVVCRLLIELPDVSVSGLPV